MGFIPGRINPLRTMISLNRYRRPAASATTW